MNRIDPGKRAQSAEQLWPVFLFCIQDGIERALRHIFHLYNLDLRQKGTFKTEKTLAVCVVKNFIGVGGVDIFHRCFGKGKIACGGKVAGPFEIVDPRGVLCGNFFRVVGGAGVYNDDLVHEIGDAVQTARQHCGLIFYNHT